MRVERLILESAVQQRDALECTGSIAILPGIVMNESSVFTMLPHIRIHIRKITSDHVQHHIMGQTLIEVFVKTFADLSFKGLFRLKKLSGIGFHS